MNNARSSYIGLDARHHVTYLNHVIEYICASRI